MVEVLPTTAGVSCKVDQHSPKNLSTLMVPISDHGKYRRQMIERGVSSWSFRDFAESYRKYT
jgi:hypothetical protein